MLKTVINKVREIKLTKRQELLLVVLLVGAGIFIRAFHFGISPVGVHQDEAMAAVDAKALSEYGTDRFGMRWPVHFTAWIGGQMSVLLSYCMVPFIKLFGFSTVSIRLPMLIVSGISLLALYYMGTRLGGQWLGLWLLVMGVICPWHYMQSRWSFDCNMFPHMFLFGFCFLLAGTKKKWALYVSMIFFALCSYSYGIADYSVPLFLIAAAVLLWRSGRVRIKDLILCISIYTLTALPEFLSMFLTVMGLESIETPFFTIPSFPHSIRSRDILFTNFSWHQLWENLVSTVTTVWANGDRSVTNTIVRFGPIYYLTTVFFLIGLAVIVVRLIKKENSGEIYYRLLLLWLIMGIWAGIVTSSVTINRINIIFYPVIAIAVTGIVWCIEKCLLMSIPILAYYGVSVLLFGAAYYGEWTELSRIYYFDSYIRALEYADTLDCDIYYITPDPQGEGVNMVGEILTLYCHEIDARYFQGASNMQNGREYLPYRERYRYMNVTAEIVEENRDSSVVYLVRPSEMTLFSEDEYEIVSIYDVYYVIAPRG